MTTSPSFHNKLALVISLLIHIAAIAFIALHTSRALPTIEGIEVITLSLGGPVGSLGGASPEVSPHHESPQKTENSAAQQQQLAQPSAQPNSVKQLPEKPQSKPQSLPSNEHDSQAIVAHELIDPPTDSPLLAKKQEPAIKQKVTNGPKEPIKKAQERQNKFLKEVSKKSLDIKENKAVAKQTSKQNELEQGNKNEIQTLSNQGFLASSQTAENSQNGQGDNSLSGNNQFSINSDGSYTALGSSGISYTILQDANPKYPKEAKSLGYTKVVKVQVRLLVGLDGQVESAEILNTHLPDLGFKEEAVKAIKKMTFKPIIYQGQRIKMYFKKTVIFQY